jgi:Cft2 family RNA processing exonuclease
MSTKNSVLCFGTGDGWPCPDRNHSAFLYRLDGASVLIDCGEPLDRAYKQTGLSYELPDAIVLSHLHSDHVGGLFMFLQGCWLEGRRKALPIYAPAGCINALKGILNAVFLFPGELPFDLQLRAITPRKPIEIGSARVTAYPTTHLDKAREKFGSKFAVDFSAYCFLLECNGARIGHSADLGSPQDLAPLLENKLDLLICELAHFLPEDLFKYIGSRDIDQTVFVHLARALHEKLPATRRLAKRLLKNKSHLFARDLQVIPLPGS